MQIEQHIREILRQHAFVAIPGVGSFCRAYSPAKIIEEENTITPPSYDFSFDTNRAFDDSAIANYLTATYGVAPFEASRCVEEWVSTLWARLVVGESITFDGVGALSRPDESVAFTPCPPSERATAYFGLLPVALPPTIVRAKGNKNRKIKRNAVLIPLFAALLGGGGYAAYYYLDWPYIASLMPWNKSSTETTATIPSAAKETPPAVTTPPRHIDTTAERQSEQSALNLVDSSLHQHNALQPVESSTLYYIVAGSFRNEENAEKQVKELRRLGFRDPKIRRENEFYQVYVAYYTSLPHAQAKLNELWQKYGEDFCFLNKVSE